MKKQLCAFAFMITMASNAMAFNDRSLFDDTSEASKWTFVENKFVTKIAAEKSFMWAHIGAGVTALVAIMTGSQLLLNRNNLNDKFSDGNVFTNGTVYGGATAFASGAFTISALDCYIAAQANRNAVTEFFSNWDKNKSFVPTELQAGFELIAEAMHAKGKQAVLKNADEIVEMIQFLVIRHFEGRYKNTLETKGRDALADTKTTSEVVKLFTETAKNLGGSSK